MDLALAAKFNVDAVAVRIRRDHFSGTNQFGSQRFGRMHDRPC
jgi:hypothetical protein